MYLDDVGLLEKDVNELEQDVKHWESKKAQLKRIQSQRSQGGIKVERAQKVVPEVEEE